MMLDFEKAVATERMQGDKAPKIYSAGSHLHVKVER